MSAVSYIALRTREHDQELTLLNQATSTIDREKYPILLSNEESKAMDYPHVLSVVKNTLSLPSQLAHLNPNNLPIGIQNIDDSFRRAIRNYKEELEFAIANDSGNVNSLNAALNIELDHTNHTKRCTKIGLWFLLIGGIPGFFIGHERDQKKNQLNSLKTSATKREQSAHRRAWLQQVDILEKQRMKDTEADMLKRMEVVIDSLQQLAIQGEFDIAFIEELENFHSIYKAVFPKRQDLVIKGTDVESFLNEIRQ